MSAKTDVISKRFIILNIKEILKEYQIDASFCSCRQLLQYPHIFNITTDGEEYFLKVLNDRLDFNYNELFNILSNNTNVLLPCKTMSGFYFVPKNNNCYFLYKRIEKPVSYPTADCWARMIAGIHQLNYDEFGQGNTEPIDLLFEQTVTMFKKAIPYMTSPLKKEMFVFFKKYKKNICADEELVISLIDPSKDNILFFEGYYKFIDLENCSINYKEYDFQHLMWNLMSDFLKKEDISDFWRLFKNEYESITGMLVNKSLLLNVYILDFIRSISWLVIVVNDKNRGDWTRQYNDLQKISESVEQGTHLFLYECFEFE